MTLKEYRNTVLQLTRGRLGYRPLKDALENAGYIRCGVGGVKVVYRHPSAPDWVVKIFHGKRGWVHDQLAVGVIPPQLEPYILRYQFVSRRFVIQPFADCSQVARLIAYDYFREQLQVDLHKVYDLHTGNMGLFNKAPVVLDYIAKNLQMPPIEQRRPRMTSLGIHW